MAQKNSTPTQVLTGKVRFSYAHVHEPYSHEEGQKAKYSVCLLIPKTDTVTIAKIKKAVEAAKQEAKGKYGGKIPNTLKLPLRDGDLEREDDENYTGMMFVNANTDRKPQIVDKNVDEIMDKEQFYSGCWGRASVNFYGYNFSGTKGVACGLGNLQVLEDGDRLSGGSSAADDFGGDQDDSLLD